MEEIPSCKHFITRKKRFCRMTVKKGEEYCGEHSINASDNTTETKINNCRQRIVCPFDKKHTCYANKLKQHLKKCNANQSVSLPYIVKNINNGISNTGSELSTQTRALSKIPVEMILKVIAKVNSIYDDVIKNQVTEEILSHSILTNELSNPSYGHETRKHLMQTSSLLGLLQKHDLLNSDTCFIEFGAGKGKLSYWVSKSTEHLDNSSVLLIERASHRHKYDNKLDKSDGRVHRIRADIADLVLFQVDVIQNSRKVVGLAKHLCGDATDLAIRCLLNSQKQKDIVGILLAFCCHHRCQWPTYTGQKFFESFGLTKEDFDVMCGLVSWAVCGSGTSRQKIQNKEVPLQSNRDAEIGLTRQQKEEIGKRCKHVLNWGRKLHLENHNFKTTLHYYVTSDVSLENACMLAVKKT